MKKNAAILMAAVFATAVVIAAANSQEYMTSVDNSVFSDPQRTPSVFRHDEHNEAAGIEECNECHHVYEDGVKLEYESSEDLACIDCHDLESDGEAPSLINAYHRNCKGCHMQQKQGPALCGECHVRS